MENSRAAGGDAARRPAAGGETVKKHSLTAKKDHGLKINPRSFFCVKISPLFRIE